MIIIVKFIKYKRGNNVINFMLVTIISALAIFVFFIKENSTVVADGKKIQSVTYQKTFSSPLSGADLNVEANNSFDKDLNAKIASNDIIAVTLKVFVDNKELNIKSTQKNIALMLKAEKITLNASDKISPSLETNLSNGMKVIITRIKIATIKQTKTIDFKTVIQKDNSSLKSLSKVAQTGVKGEKSVTYNVTYENGKEVTRKVISEKVIKAPKSKIIVQGTLPTITFSRGASSKTSEDIISVKATAYYAFNGVNNTYTASGKKAVRNPNSFSTIAVDTKIIPMGTKLYVEGYGYAIAADKGSGIKGKYIDVYFNTRKEALTWGVKYIKVQIIH